MAKEWLKRVLPEPIRDTIIYSRYFVLRYFRKTLFKSYYLIECVTLREVDSRSDITFLGYYDLIPDNKNRVLFISVNDEKKRGSQFEDASICLKDKTSLDVRVLEKTSSWNWQQGSKLQWLKGVNENKIIFNDYDSKSDKYISKIIDHNGLLIKTIKKPIYCVQENSKLALTLNFDRLRKLRPDYGYFNKRNFDLPNNDEDGIWLINLESNECELIIDLKVLCDLRPKQSMEDAIHKVNHIMFSPSGKRFMFLHRWIGTKGRYTRLITSDIKGENLKILNGDEMTSHCCWINENNILAYCTIKGKGTGYYLIEDNTGYIEKFTENMPKVDGHPSISPDSEWIITDTYPDLSRFSKLYLYNIKSDTRYFIGKFYQPLRYKKEMRIDLHPKWSKEGKSVYIESGHLGKRKLFEVDVSKILDKH